MDDLCASSSRQQCEKWFMAKRLGLRGLAGAYSQHFQERAETIHSLPIEARPPAWKVTGSSSASWQSPSLLRTLAVEPMTPRVGETTARSQVRASLVYTQATWATASWVDAHALHDLYANREDEEAEKWQAWQVCRAQRRAAPQGQTLTRYPVHASMLIW